MQRIVLMTWALVACSAQPVETPLIDVGFACIDDGEVLVDFETCLSSSCDTLEDAECEATLDGTTVVVTASATVVSSGNECTADCGFAQVRCALPAGSEGATLLSYGGQSTDIAADCPT